MQQRHAHEGRHDEELMRKNHATVTTMHLRLPCVECLKKKYIQAAHRMSVAVCSMLIAGGLVAAVSSGSSVHEPETHN